MPGKPGFNTKDASPNQENTFHDDGRNQADDIMAASESLYTDEWQEGSQDLDAMIEFNTFVPSEQDDDLNSDAFEISVVTKKDQDEEQDQKGTPLTNTNDYDFSKDKKFKLPCSNRQLEKMMREIGIDGIATTEASCKVKITNAVCPALRDMVVESPNFRELNFLAKLIKKMPAEEMRKFNKIVEYERQINPDITPKDIINIRYNLDNYKVHDVSGAKTVEERFQKLGAHFTPKVQGENDAT